MTSVLVTGASGYIGHHLIAALVESGISVRGFARHPEPEEMPDVEWHQGDVRRLSDLLSAMDGCDTVIHLACLPLSESWKDSNSGFEINALGTLKVLEAARRVDAKRIIYTSSAQVYGDTKDLPISEDTLPQPNSPYAASKLCGEVLCDTFTRAFGLDTIVLRLFNVYGSPISGKQRSTVETVFLRSVIQGNPPVITGNPEEGRDFIHVNDVVRAIHLAMDAKVSREAINVGSGVMTTLLELAEICIDLCGVPMEPLKEGTVPPRPLRLRADMHKAYNLLGFIPSVTLLDGLRRMLSNRELL